MSTYPPCAFCDRTEFPLTKEHVYPRSWKQHFPDQDGPVLVRQFGRKGYVAHRGANHQFDNQVRDICADCNNGWMMLLDEKAKPFVIPLASGERTHLSVNEAAVLRSWATKTALVRTLQDRGQSQQARPERFREFFSNREPFGALVVQAAIAEPHHMDGNTAWINPDEMSAVSNIVGFSLGRLFVQVGIHPPNDEDHEPLTRMQLAAVRQLTMGKVHLVRHGRSWESRGVVSETELVMAREPAALIGAAPAMENAMQRVPVKEMPGGSFGNPHGVPDINELPWRTYE